MKNNFDEDIKNIEAEILALKTATDYTSVRSAQFSSSTLVRTGLYRITYDTGGEDIFSIIYVGTAGSDWGLVYPRTPNGNTQVVEVATTFLDSGQYITKDVPIAIVSNVPVTSIVRI